MTTEAPAVPLEGYEKNAMTVRTMIQSRMGEIKGILPKHMNADHMVRVFLNSIQRTPALLECTPISLMGALLMCSQFGLEPDGLTRQAYLVPFKNKAKGVREVQVIIGYGGLCDLARRSGEISAIEARVVREKDEFSMEFGTAASVHHKPYIGAGDAGEPIGFYAVAHYKNSHTHYDHMTKRDVDAIRARSKADEGGFSPWQTDYIEMGKKTVIRRLCKLLPSSVSLQRAVSLDERNDLNMAQDLALLADPTEKSSDAVVEEAADLMPKRTEETKKAAPTGNANKTDRTPMRQMQSRFPNTCPDCGGKIFKGEQICYSDEMKKAFHPVCPDTEVGA